MNNLVIIVTPDIKSLNAYLSPFESASIKNLPKGFSTNQYFADLSQATELSDIGLVVCAETKFSSHLKKDLSGLVENKRYVSLNFLEGCKRVAAIEQVIFETGLSKIQLPVKEGAISPNSPIIKLLSECARHCKEDKPFEFNKALTAYRRQYQFNLQLEAAFLLAHSCSNRENLEKLLNSAPQNTLLDDQVRKLLKHAQIKKVLNAPNLGFTQDTDNQFFNLCNSLFDPSLLD